MPTYLEAYRAARGTRLPSADLNPVEASIPPKAPQDVQEQFLPPGPPPPPSPIPAPKIIKEVEETVEAAKPRPKSAPAKPVTPKKSLSKAPSKPKIDIGKQKGQFDTKAVRTQVHKWQALAAAEAALDVEKLSEDDDAQAQAVPNQLGKKRATSKNTDLVEVSIVKDKDDPDKILVQGSAEDLAQEVKKSTAPKKRVVSDEHWKRDRSSPKSAEQPKVIKGFTLGFETAVYVAPGAKQPEGFARRRVTPSKKTQSPKEPSPKKQRDGTNQHDVQAKVEKVNEARRPSGKTRSSDIDSPLRPVLEDDEGFERPKSEPEKPSKSMAENPFKNAQVRKSRRVTRVATDPQPEAKSANFQPIKNRMEAWLNQTPDPFTEKFDDANDHVARSTLLNDLGSMLGPRTTQVRDKQDKDDDRHRRRRRRKREAYDDGSPVQSDDDADSSPLSSLKRSGARRSAHSPRGNSRPPSADLEPQLRGEDWAIQLAPVPVELATTRQRSHRSHRKGDSSRTRRSLRYNIASHADLLSVLSLPADEGRGLVPATSIRTTRSRKNGASLQDLLDEMQSDESKYLRELRTLVEGVIPVLLNSVLTGSIVNQTKNASRTKSFIVDLGIALERLQMSHRRIPLDSTAALLSWAQRSHQVYADYIAAWKMDFKDVMINLAPGEDTVEAIAEYGYDAAKHDLLPKGEGERVDVSFLLKRPLVRLKYLAKTIKGINQVDPGDEAALWAEKYQGLVDDARAKQDVERARLEDEAAAAIDNTRARDPRTLAPVAAPAVRTDRCVRARDVFDLHMDHSNGQRLDCRVMLFLRDDKTRSGGGDLLICQTDETLKWLLFPPTDTDKLSARMGDSEKEIVVMLRGQSVLQMEEWRELLCLTSETEETAADWLQMIGTDPIPAATIVIPSAAAESPKVDPKISKWFGSMPQELGEPDDALSEYDLPLGEQSVLSSRSNMSIPRKPVLSSTKQSSLRQVQFNNDPEKIERPPQVGYTAKAKDNLRSFFSDFQKTKIVPAAPLENHPPRESRRNSPDRPALRRQLSPIPSESIPTAKTRSPEHSPVRSQWSNVDPESQHSLSPEAETPTSRSRYHRRATSSSATAPSPEANKQIQIPLADLRGVSTPQLSPSTPGSGLRRRSSSPLKYEYHLSSPSEGSPAASQAGSEDEGSVTSESSVDDLVPELYPEFELSKEMSARTRPSSVYSPKGPPTVAPSQSASQVPYGQQTQRVASGVSTTVASIFSWSDKGIWEPLHPDECSIVVSPGLIEAFKMSSAHSLPQQHDPGSPLHDRGGTERPLVALELTPLVPLRQGTAIDISIRSPPTANSLIRTSNNIMFRSRTGGECDTLYNMINQSRINNPTYIALQNARGPFGGSNWASYMDRKATTRSSGGWWRFGSRKSSYRASTRRHTASVAETRSSVASMSSAISALKRFSSGSKMFSVARSTISSRPGNSNSRSSTTFTGSSGSSTPIVIDSTKGTPAGMTNIKIRMYEREMSSKWRDLGSARLTIMHPPRPTSALITPTGHLRQEKRILVTGKNEEDKMLDVTLGETSFERVARTGIAVKVWEQYHEVGRTGGVLSARMRVFMIQMKSEAEAAYTFSLVGRQRY